MMDEEKNEAEDWQAQMLSRMERDEEEMNKVPDFSDVKYWYCRRRLIALGATVDEAIEMIAWEGTDDLYRKLIALDK